MAMSQPIVLPGEYAAAGLPPAVSARMNFAWVTDQPEGARLYFSDGISWRKAQKRIEVYSGITDASGNYTVSFGAVYPTTPHINPQLYPTTLDVNVARLTAVSANGFTAQVTQRSKLTVLGIDLLSFASTPVVGANISVLVAEV